MQVYTNRYYKDNYNGYGFLSKTGVFGDSALLERIDRLIGKVIGNRSVSCWMGGVVSDVRGAPFYVFGHNRMIAQEQGSNRLSCQFTFAVVPFDALVQLGSPSELISALTQAESNPGFQPSILTLNEGTGITESRYDLLLADALAAYAVDERIDFEYQDSWLSCCKVLGSIWNKTLFSRKTPVITLTDEQTADQPQLGWRLITRAGKVSARGGILTRSNLAPEEAYLYNAYRYLLANGTEEYRRVLSAREAARVAQAIGGANDKLLEPLLLWYYNLHSRMEVLPTEEEKAAMLRQIV